MPRTLPENWIETETLWEPADEIRSSRHWSQHIWTKSLRVAQLRLANRAAIGQTRSVVQRQTWTCPYCQSHSPSRGRIRRRNIQQQFTELAGIWKKETAHQSNMTKRAMHPAYQRIIGMGPVVVPFMLERFRQGALEHWFWALTAITGENPITEDIAGNIEEMAKAWVQWGKAHGYLTDSIRHLKPCSPTLETEGTS
jgi:hypothetical protein